MNSSDKHLYKLVIVAAALAVLVYFQRNRRDLEVVENSDYLREQRVKFPDETYQEVYRPASRDNYKTRNLNWFAEIVASRTNRTRNESETDSDDSDDDVSISRISIKHTGHPGTTNATDNNKRG